MYDPNTQVQLNEYIRQSLAQGFDLATIQAHLVQSGWPVQAAEEAVRLYGAQSPLATPLPMPPTAGYISPKKPRSKLPWIFGGLGVLLVIVVAAILIHGHAAAPKLVVKPVTDPAVTGAGLSTLQRNSQNTQRKNDVSAIVAGIDEYVSNHAGTLPTQTAPDTTAHQLDICGPSCADGKTVVALQYYENAVSAVSFHAFFEGLTVPDSTVVYIVPGATCNGTVIAAGQSRSVAVLFATIGTNGAEQQCVAN